LYLVLVTLCGTACILNTKLRYAQWREIQKRRVASGKHKNGVFGGKYKHAVFWREIQTSRVLAGNTKYLCVAGGKYKQAV
jgi:hypothetical protein